MSKLAWVILAVAPVVCVAESPFAGTWTVQPEATEFRGRSLGLLVDKNEYKRTSCTTARQVPTDGKDHPIGGDPLLQTMSVKLVDAHRVEVVQKIADLEVWKGSYVVSKDGKSLTLTYRDQRSQLPTSATLRYIREGEVVPNAHLLSGIWAPQQISNLSAAAVSFTLRDTENGLQMSAADGRGFETNFQVKDVPLSGYLAGASVLVLKRSDHTLQINRKQKNVLVNFSVGDISADGRTMSLMEMDWQCQSITDWKLQK
jgi:hypothetical protein